MKLKSYFAGTVQAAMVLAREELGPEAMLVQSKRTTAETRHMGQYEVVFALQDPETPVPVPPVEAARPSFQKIFSAANEGNPRDTAIEQLSVELELLKRRIESMSGTFPPGPAPASIEYGRRRNSVIRSLIEQDIEPALAEALAREIAGNDGDPDALRAALEAAVSVDPTLGAANASRRIVALVGPPGAGKTTALVKLATQYGLKARRSMHLLSTDVYRVGAAEQLRLYASILGVGFQTIETPVALAQAVEEQRHKDLVFIDTPGWALRDVPEIQELAGYIGNDPDIDVHLVLPASNRAGDLAKTVDRYAIFRPGKLLFTRIDETDRRGPLLNESRRTGKPVSFICTGEQIPEDLEPATAARIVELILGPARASETAEARAPGGGGGLRTFEESK
jgi:flagellar biosynthesis protein FlhF